MDYKEMRRSLEIAIDKEQIKRVYKRAYRKAWIIKPGDINQYIYFEPGKRIENLQEPLKRWFTGNHAFTSAHLNMIFGALGSSPMIAVGFKLSEEDKTADDWVIYDKYN